MRHVCIVNTDTSVLFSFSKERIHMKLTPVTYTHDPVAYKQMAKFNTLKALNTAFEMWLADYKGLFGKKELQALKTLVRHSAKVAGIATIKFKSLVKVAREKFNFNFTTRTAKRAVEKARNLGMLVTLETRSAKTNLKGPSVYVWQPYKSQNVTTGNVTDNVAEIAKECDEIKRQQQSQEIPQPRALATKMSPHKAINIKANIIKLLNTYTYGFKSIAYSMTVKKEKNITLLTQPVQPKHEIAPLKPISRLKQAMYSSYMNRKSDVKAVTEMVYGKVNSYTRFDCWKEHRDTMLEHAIRVVEVCLESRKNGQLNHIKSMRGFINHALNQEIEAYVFKVQKQLAPAADPNVIEDIVDMYDEALKANKAYFEQQLNLYYR